MASLTPNFGLNYFGGNTPGAIIDDGSKFTGADRLQIDRMLYALATATRHRTDAGSSPETSEPAATVGTSGGISGGVTYTYCVTLVDENGLETLPSPEVTVSTPALLDEPEEPLVEYTDAPTLSWDGGVTLSDSYLSAGLYFYALTALRLTEESTLGVQVSISLDVEGRVQLAMPAPPAGTINFQVWRMGANDVGWTRLGLVVPVEGAYYIDDGHIPSNTNADDPSQAPPATNFGLGIYSVFIELAEADADLLTGGSYVAWNIYRTETPSAYPATALVAHVVDVGDPEDDGDGTVATSYVDDGDILLDGAPPISSTQLRVAPYVFDEVDALPLAADYPLNYPLVYAGHLYVQLGGAWVQVGSGSGGQSFVSSTKFGVD